MGDYVQNLLFNIENFKQSKIDLLSKISQVVFLIFIIAIEYLATTSLEIRPLENFWDKANHFVAFLSLYVTLSFGYPKLEVFKKVAFLLAFGLQIEIVQYFLPNREFSLLDVFADGIGIVLGIVAVKALWCVMDNRMRF